MKVLVPLLFLLIHIQFTAGAQSPSIVANFPELACLGKAHKIPITVTGSFNNDNTFTVQLREKENSVIITTLPGTLKAGNIEVTYQDSTLSIYPSLQFRIASSSPKTESNWTTFKVHTKGIIQLSSAISDTVNSGEELPIKFITRSTTEVDITLNDGSQFEIAPYSQSEFTTYQQIKANTREPFYMKSAANSCGGMLKSGQITPVFNSTSVRTASADAFNVCEDSEIRIAFASIGAALSPGSNYRVRFRSIPFSFLEKAITVEAKAELKDGFIVTRFPADLKLTDKMNFKAIILADGPGIVGAPGSFILTAHPKPTVAFYTPDLTINVGEETRVGVIFKGVPPFSAVLGDGSIISASYSGEVFLNKKPDKTTTYSIRSISSGCGITNLPVQQNMTVKVNEGIALMPESNPQILCVGSTSRIRIKSNGSFGSGTSYTVHAYYSGTKEFIFPATRNGDYLEFVIPELKAGIDPSLSYDGLNNLFVTSNNPGQKSAPSYIYLIQSKPLFVPSPYNIYSYDEPQVVRLTYNIYGKWPFIIEDEQGKLITVKNDWWAPEIYLDKTKDFKVKSISNACFKTENLPPTQIILTNNTAPGLYLEPIKNRACANDSLLVTFSAPGNFNADNLFHIQAYSDCCNFITLKTVRAGGVYKVKIPPSQNNFAYPVSIKVVSTNPLFVSETRQFSVDSPLTNFSADPMGTEAQPALILQSTDQRISFRASGGGVTSIVYSDGISDKTVQFENPNDLGFKIAATPGVVTAYTLKSMTNSCGTQQANVSTYVKILPFQIKITDFDFSSTIFCTGNQITVPFATENGETGNATFSLQISRDSEINYKTIASGEASRIFRATLPTDLGEGYYKMQVISSNGAVSNSARFYVSVLPSAIISTTLPQPITVSGGGSLNLTLNFTGSSPWTAVYEDNTSQTTTINPDVRKISPNIGQVFGLKTVYNLCGYGKVSGSVDVKVKAGLITHADNYAGCAGKNFAINYELQGDADLSNDYIRFELIDPENSKTILLDSTRVRSGKLDLKLPSNLSGSHYQIRCTVKKSGLVSDVGISMTSPAEVTLGGNTVINSGEQTQLIIRSNKMIPGLISFQLSDGTRGTFLAGTTDSYISVSPNQTTTYTLSSVSNSCGSGKAYGSATVEVNPVSARTISISGLSSSGSGMCLGDSLFVSYTKTGAFTAGNVMTIQISDTTGKNFKSLVTKGTQSPLRTVIPVDLFPGKHYRLRVIASDAGTASGAYQFPLTPGQKSTARFASESASYNGVDDPVIVVLLEGGGPWRYDLGTDSNSQTQYSSTATDSVYLQQASPGQTYKLLNVYNQCGAGTIKTPATVTVSVITGEPAPILSRMTAAPNPTSDFLVLKFEVRLPRSITLFDTRGISLQKKLISNNQESIDLRQLSSGIYIIQVEESDRKSTFKIVKQ